MAQSRGIEQNSAVPGLAHHLGEFRYLWFFTGIGFQSSRIQGGRKLRAHRRQLGGVSHQQQFAAHAPGKTLHLHDLRFAEVTVRLVDYPEQEPFDCQILLNTLDHEGPSLDYETMKRFYDSVRQDYASLSRYRQMEAVRKDPYFNALQVKFAYAVTCHKAQGGQWEQVFVEQAWLPNGQVDLDYLRWLYTAFTRAVSRLYLIGFPETYFRS